MCDMMKGNGNAILGERFRSALRGERAWVVWLPRVSLRFTLGYFRDSLREFSR